MFNGSWKHFRSWDQKKKTPVTVQIMKRAGLTNLSLPVFITVESFFLIQKRVVNVYRLITRGTLEEKIMGLQKFKMNIANTVISQENSSLQSMGTDQLLDLFTLDKVKNLLRFIQSWCCLWWTVRGRTHFEFARLLGCSLLRSVRHFLKRWYLKFYMLVCVHMCTGPMEAWRGRGLDSLQLEL